MKEVPVYKFLPLTLVKKFVPLMVARGVSVVAPDNLDILFFDNEQRRVLDELFAKWDLLKDTVNELVVAANPCGGTL